MKSSCQVIFVSIWGSPVCNDLVNTTEHYFRSEYISWIAITKTEFCNHRFIFSVLIPCHCNDVIMCSMASQITSLTIVYSAVYSGADQRKHQSSASVAFVPGIHRGVRGPVNFQHKWPVTRKMLMTSSCGRITANRHDAYSVFSSGTSSYQWYC